MLDGHSAAGRIIIYIIYNYNITTGRIVSMKDSNDPIGSRTRDLPACSAVPQATAPPHAPPCPSNEIQSIKTFLFPAWVTFLPYISNGCTTDLCILVTEFLDLCHLKCRQAVAGSICYSWLILTKTGNISKKNFVKKIPTIKCNDYHPEAADWYHAYGLT